MRITSTIVIAGVVGLSALGVATPANADPVPALTSVTFSASQVASAGTIDIQYNGSATSIVAVAGYCRLTVFQGQIRSTMGLLVDTSGDQSTWTPSNFSGTVQPYEVRMYDTGCDTVVPNFATAVPIFTDSVDILPALDVDDLTVATGDAVDEIIDYTYLDGETTTLINAPGFRAAPDNYCSTGVGGAFAGPTALAPGLSVRSLSTPSGAEPVLEVTGTAGAPGTYHACVATGTTAAYITITISGPKLAETGADAARTAALLGGGVVLVLGGGALLILRRRAAKRLRD